MESNNKESNSISFTSILLLIVVLYFAWSARSAVDYFGSDFFVRGMIDAGGFSSIVGNIWEIMGALIVTISILLIFREFFDDTVQSSGLTALFTLLWPLAGWYVGYKFDPSQSPKLAYMAFSGITVFLAISHSVWLISFVGRKISTTSQ